MRERCRVCNRPLITQKSKQREVGIKCYRKWRKGYRGAQIEQGENMEMLRNRLIKAKMAAIGRTMQEQPVIQQRIVLVAPS